MPGEMLVHLEHGHLVLAEDALELVVGQDLAAVLRVLQVVGLDVLPHLAHHLAPGQRSWADHRSQRFGRLQRPLQRVRPAAACGGLLRRLLRCPGWHRSPPIRAAILARGRAGGSHCRTDYGRCACSRVPGATWLILPATLHSGVRAGPIADWASGSIAAVILNSCQPFRLQARAAALAGIAALYHIETGSRDHGCRKTLLLCAARGHCKLEFRTASPPAAAKIERRF